MEPIRIGFVGFGSHARRSHYKIALQLPNLFLPNAVFEFDQDRWPDILDLKPNPPELYASLDALLRNADVEAVIIASPDTCHLEQLEQCVAAGKNVLCEKPLWIDNENERGTKALKTAAEAGLIVTSCHPRRFDRSTQELIRQLPTLQKKFGRIKEFRYRFFYHKPTKEWQKNRSLLMDHMNHEIDVANFVLGHSPVTLKKLDDRFDHYETWGRRKDGILLDFAGSRNEEEHVYINYMIVAFERGDITIKSVLENGISKFDTTIVDYTTEEPIKSPAEVLSPETPFMEVMLNFAQAIRGQAKNYLTVEDLLRNTISCNELVATGKWTG